MLQKIRDNAHGWWTYVLVPVLILLFALWGIGNYLGGSFSQSQVAKVNDQAISISAFSTLYQSMQNANPHQDTKTLKLQALQSLVNKAILSQGLHQIGFAISDTALDQIIYQIPAFQQNGQFSMERYQAFLQNIGETTEALRADLRQSFLVQQFQNGLLASQFALPSEITAETNYANMLRNIAYITVPISHFTPRTPPTDAAIQAYYTAHQNAFMTPLHVKLAYVTLSKAQFAKKGENAEANYSAALNKASNLAFQNPGSLQPLAKGMGVSVQTTPMLSTDQPTGILANADVLKAVQSSSVLQQGNNSAVINLSADKAVVVHVVNSIAAQPLPLAKVKNAVITTIQKQQAQKAATAALSSMVSAINQGGNLANVTKAYGFKPKIVTKVSADNKTLPPEIVNSILDLGVNQATLTRLPNGDLTLVEVTQAYPNPKAATHPVPANAISGLWVQIELSQYLASQQDQAKVKINQAIFKN